MSIAEALIDFGEDDNIGDEVLEDGKCTGLLLDLSPY
jgi:hypothetical protein